MFYPKLCFPWQYLIDFFVSTQTTAAATMNFDFEIDTYIKNEIGGEWDEFLSSERITIIVTKVTVTNEDSKTLTNLSTEVFNQLETTYTNY